MATPRPHAGQQSAQEQALRQQLEPVVRALGLVLDEVVVAAAGSRRLLRVVVDLPDDQTAPVSMDAVADAAREVSSALDAADPMGQSPYTLEVTSPGVERPLTERRHLRRNLGRTLTLTLTDGGTVSGRLLSMDDDALVLLLPGAKKGMPATKKRTVALAEVVSGVVQVEFTHAPGTEPVHEPDVDEDDELDDDDLDDDDLDDDDLDDDDELDDEDDHDDDRRS